MKYSIEDLINKFNTYEKCMEFRNELIAKHQDWETYWKDAGGRIIRESDVEQMSDCEALQTHDIMLALCLRQPLYMELLDDIDVEFTDDDYFKIADVYFTDEEKRKHIEWDNQPMADRHWQIVAKEHIDIDDLISRDDCPRYVFEEWLSTATRYDIAKLPSISGKDLYLYFQHNNNEYDIKELLGKGSNSCKCPDLETLLKLDGSYIKYIKNPKVGLCKAAIDNDPYNIKYIDVTYSDIEYQSFLLH